MKKRLRLTAKERHAILEAVNFRLAGDYDEEVDDDALESAREKLLEWADRDEEKKEQQ